MHKVDVSLPVSETALKQLVSNFRSALNREGMSVGLNQARKLIAQTFGAKSYDSLIHAVKNNDQHPYSSAIEAQRLYETLDKAAPIEGDDTYRQEVFLRIFERKFQALTREPISLVHFISSGVLKKAFDSPQSPKMCSGDDLRTISGPLMSKLPPLRMDLDTIVDSFEKSEKTYHYAQGKVRRIAMLLSAKLAASYIFRKNMNPEKPISTVELLFPIYSSFPSVFQKSQSDSPISRIIQDVWVMAEKDKLQSTGEIISIMLRIAIFQIAMQDEPSKEHYYAAHLNFHAYYQDFPSDLLDIMKRY